MDKDFHDNLILGSHKIKKLHHMMLNVTSASIKTLIPDIRFFIFENV